MASRWRTWDTDFACEVLRSPSVHLMSTPINHSFGRGDVKTRAEQVVFPKAALEYEATSQNVGVATSEMGGVHTAPKPKASGRSRALKMRGSIVQQRRPGQLSGRMGDGESSGRSTPSSVSSGEAAAGITQSKLRQFVNEDNDPWPNLDKQMCATNILTSEYWPPLKAAGERLPAHVSSGDLPDWPLDENTLCFQNLPNNVTSEELKEVIETYGKVSHCMLLPIPNEAGLMTAYVRMQERSACDWVVSYFHAHPYDDSPVDLTCYFAVSK